MKERDRARGTETGDRGAIFHVTGGPPSFACHQFNSLVKFIESHILRYFAHLQWYSTEATHTHTHTHTYTNRRKQRNSLLTTEKPVKTRPVL